MVEHRQRSRNDIIASILEVANGNRVRTTEIQFKAYLSYTLLKEYLALLLENDLLEYIEGERAFKTTPKGMHFLHTHEKMSEMIMMTGTATRKPVNEFLL
ncbi:MAG TPA: winged helix-turn-helix domain-containing protein [Nitrososphaeraceae archaeon]|jgi:predicted transcriptional regulator|nr:winged helix-turn-helix domain-containing protein [Nitrososphaeraceae archaeon]